MLLALPWLLWPLALVWRLRESRSLDEEAAGPPDDAPLLSVIVPARDERRNVARCVRSVLASTYPRLELLVVDDHSTDGTADLARGAAGGDARLRVLDNPPLPDGWFGKQWACATGAAAARGELLLFTDADTEHGPELHARAVRALRSRDAGLLTVSGTQEMQSVWERLVQPQLFAIILLRFGGTERVNRSRRARDKIANGQFLLFTRAAYDAVGGHAAVRHTVAEDLAFAQRAHALGQRTALVLGDRHLRTRMYASLGELVRGWRKNVFAGGREAMPGGAVGRALFPFLLPLPALLQLLPVLALVAGLLGLVPTPVLLWGAAATAALVVAWATIHRGLGHPVRTALGFPLGAAVLLHIVLSATARGRQVAWKGRAYRHR